MRPLIMNDEVRAMVGRVVSYAEQHVISWPEVQARATGAIRGAVGDDPRRLVVIPFGYRCCFSIQMRRTQKMRQLSVSVTTEGHAPNEHALHEIAKLFGFVNGIKGEGVKVFVEQGGTPAINVVELFP